MKIIKGTEQGVNWEIDESKFNPIMISVYQIDKPEVGETIIHQLNIPSAIFGYDCLDISIVNDKLDKLIKKYAV